ncbi:MAG: ABC transporter substrate-binding protein, partial [Pseudomonadota bacterium]
MHRTLKQTARVLVALAAMGLAAAPVSALETETRTLDELYAAALAEGGEFVLRAGGDEPGQIDYYLDKFKARFPELKVTHSVDVSINHAPRFDNARAAGGETNIPDIIQFQTLHDFNHYMEQGLLLPYKPADWDKVFPDHKDPHGR